MGCGGGCPKKTLRLKSDPQAITPEQLKELRAFVDHQVRVKDRLGITTQGRLVEIWVDDTQGDGVVELGNIAIETHLGINMIGLDMIEQISPTPQ